MHSSSLALLGLTLTTLVSARSLPRASTGCVGAGAVHMIVARASTEPAGEGIIGSVATSVKKSLPGSDSEAVVYPATLQSYATSEAAGVSAMTKLVQDYATRCPDSKIAVMGYSQGANVAGDVMCGSSAAGMGGIGKGASGAGASTSASTKLSADAAKNVVAMVLMGDPTHVPTDSFNAGTSKKAGMFPRKNSANCPAAITVSYCDTGDTFCDSGKSTMVHLSYVTRYGTAAAKFITDKVSGSSISTGSTSTNKTTASDSTSGAASAAALGATTGASSLDSLGSSTTGASSLGSSTMGASSLSSLGSSSTGGLSLSALGSTTGSSRGSAGGMGGMGGMGFLSSLFGSKTTKSKTRATTSQRDILTRDADNDGGRNSAKFVRWLRLWV